MPSKILIIGYVWPEPKSSAAGTRMMQLIEFFLLNDYAITFATTAVETPYMVNLKAMGVQTTSIELNSESFNFFLEELQPQIVLFDRFMMEEQFGWRVDETCPQALKILDTEDLHFLRKAREVSVRKDEELNFETLHSDIAKREIASIYRCDLTLIISNFELNLLQKHFKIPDFLLLYLPLFSEEINDDSPNFEDRRHFISIGNFRHEPNRDAAIQLKEKIWPLIRKKLPKAELHIYGAYPTEKIFQLHDDKNGFIVKGRAANAYKVLRNARVLLAPLRFGAGIKGKFLDAMATGTPSVTTRTGAEAMHGDKDWGGSIQDEEQFFSQAAIELYSSKQAWEKARENGYMILKEFYIQSQHQESLKTKLELMLTDLKKHREKNFTGAMLSHHSLQSARYLSKYIEVKNRLREK